MTFIKNAWMRKVVVGGVVVAIALGLVVFTITRGGADKPASRTASDCSGPWSECSDDAFWLREVAARLGFDDLGPGNGAALVLSDVGVHSEVFLSAQPAVGQLDKVEYSPYKPLARVGDTRVYGSRSHVRLVWSAQGRYVYVEPPPEVGLLRNLVRLTQSVPAPARGSGSGSTS